MNRQRRKAITQIKNQLEELQERVEHLMSEEEDAIENLPDNLKDSGKGETMQEYADHLSSALEQMQNAVEDLEACE